jgi:uncharacterized membrane protein
MMLLVFGLGPVLAASFVTFQVPGCPGDAMATAINDKGVIVGTCGVGQNFQGFIRDPFGHFTLLPNLFPNAINIHGAITGETTGPNQGFVRSDSGVVTTFSAGLGATFPVAINDKGQIVGTREDSIRHAFLREPDGTFVTFLEFGSQANAISDLGDIVGAEDRNVSIPQSFLRAPSGIVTFVGPMIGAPPPTPYDWAVSINRTGTAWLGIANTFSFLTLKTESHGYIQTSPTVPPRLFLLTDPVDNSPLPFQRAGGGGINASRAAAIQNLYVAPDGSISQIDLGACGNVSAQGINDSGWVTGYCTMQGQSFGFLWRKH